MFTVSEAHFLGFPRGRRHILGIFTGSEAHFGDFHGVGGTFLGFSRGWRHLVEIFIGSEAHFK